MRGTINSLFLAVFCLYWLFAVTGHPRKTFSTLTLMWDLRVGHRGACDGNLCQIGPYLHVIHPDNYNHRSLYVSSLDTIKDFAHIKSIMPKASDFHGRFFMLDVLTFPPSPTGYNSVGPPVSFFKLPAHAIHSNKRCSFYSKFLVNLVFTFGSVFCGTTLLLHKEFLVLIQLDGIFNMYKFRVM